MSLSTDIRSLVSIEYVARFVSVDGLSAMTWPSTLATRRVRFAVARLTRRTRNAWLDSGTLRTERRTHVAVTDSRVRPILLHIENRFVRSALTYVQLRLYVCNVTAFVNISQDDYSEQYVFIM